MPDAKKVPAVRLRRIPVANPELGSVFVYESEVFQKATEAQDKFLVQDDLPALESGYLLTLPPGWHAKGKLLNGKEISAVVEGNSSTWVLQNLPYREWEASAPRSSGTGPILAIDYEPAAGISDPPAFRNWSEVSRWHSQIADPQSNTDAPMAAKVRELIAGSTNEYERVRAIGHFVQRFRYIEISMDLSNNGGVRPHLATQVFSRQYGDCKDKANLMRAMLKVAGIESYPVILYSGDRTYVKKEWASPSQFNHMILAIQLKSRPAVPVVADSTIGPVLLFDPTDEKTPVGDLPMYEQGSYGLLCAGDKGELLQFPVNKPELNLISEEVKADLDEKGGLRVTLARQSAGQSARGDRGLYSAGSPDDYRKAVERRLARYASGVTIDSLSPQDQYEQNGFSLHVKFGLDHYAQLMRGKMLVLNLAVVAPPVLHLPPVEDRVEPIMLDGRVYRKHVEVQVPSGYTLDEMPSPYRAESSFGKFKIVYRHENGRLMLDEELQTETLTVPAAEYAAVKKFFDNALAADSQKAVLVKN